MIISKCNVKVYFINTNKKLETAYIRSAISPELLQHAMKSSVIIPCELFEAYGRYIHGVYHFVLGRSRTNNS